MPQIQLRGRYFPNLYFYLSAVLKSIIHTFKLVERVALAWSCIWMWISISMSNIHTKLTKYTHFISQAWNWCLDLDVLNTLLWPQHWNSEIHNYVSLFRWKYFFFQMGNEQLFDCIPGWRITLWAWNQIWSSFLRRCLENMSFCCLINM